MIKFDFEEKTKKNVVNEYYSTSRIKFEPNIDVDGSKLKQYVDFESSFSGICDTSRSSPIYNEDQGKRYYSNSQTR